MNLSFDGKYNYSIVQLEKPGGSVMGKLSNEEIIAMVKEKVNEKNDVIREQQIQIQELQERIAELESKVSEFEQTEKDREELINKLSEVLE